jgi:hypothetical protein
MNRHCLIYINTERSREPVIVVLGRAKSKNKVDYSKEVVVSACFARNAENCSARPESDTASI